MSCIEGLCTLLPHVDFSKWKSGISTMPFFLSEGISFSILLAPASLLLCWVIYFLKSTGQSATCPHFLDELLSLMVQQKRLILSDRDVLPSFLTTLLSSSFRSLLVPETIGHRFSSSIVVTFHHVILIIDSSIFSLTIFVLSFWPLVNIQKVGSF